MTYGFSNASLDRTLMTFPTAPTGLDAAFDKRGMKAVVTKKMAVQFVK